MKKTLLKNWVKFEDFKKEAFKNKKVKKAYDDLELEYKIIEMLIHKRVEQKLTQRALAKKLGFKQPVISRLESGNYNPSVKFLRKVVKALDAKLTITIS